MSKLSNFLALLQYSFMLIPTQLLISNVNGATRDICFADKYFFKHAEMKGSHPVTGEWMSTEVFTECSQLCCESKHNCSGYHFKARGDAFECQLFSCIHTDPNEHCIPTKAEEGVEMSLMRVFYDTELYDPTKYTVVEMKKDGKMNVEVASNKTKIKPKYFRHPVYPYNADPYAAQHWYSFYQEHHRNYTAMELGGGGPPRFATSQMTIVIALFVATYGIY